MEKNVSIVIFDELKDEEEISEDNKEKPSSYYLFNEILENSTETDSQRSFIPIVDNNNYKSVSVYDPNHVIMVISLRLIEDIEETTPSYWESYVYWHYSRAKIRINNLIFSKIVNRIFQWLLKMKKMPFVVITGFKDDENRVGLSRISIIRCLAYNGIPNDRLFFIDDGQCERDILIIKDLVRVVKTSLY
jgi:hypothetical protein